MIKVRFNSLLIFIVISVATLLSGCSTATVSESMVVNDIHSNKRSSHSIGVSAHGGHETSGLGKAQVSDEALADALVESLNNSGTFSKVIHGDDADYLLNVTIIELIQPSFGASFSVTLEIAWSLIRKDNKEVVMRESIESSSTATMGDALIAVTRLRLATEGAVRENIRLGLEKITKLQF